MKILAFSDVSVLESPVEKLQPIILEEKIDAVLLMGGLFSNNTTKKQQKDIEVIKKRKSKNQQTTSIPELNWLLIPILVIPDIEDLKMNKLIKQVQGQETVWVRFLHDKGTILDNWFIFSITESPEADYESLLKNIEEYAKLAPENSILLYSGEKRLNFPLVNAIILSNKSKKPDLETFIVSVDSIKEGIVTIIDLDKKTVNSLVIE